MTRVIQRTLSERPPIAISGEGIWLHLQDGKQVIDGSGGAAVACIGHGNVRVAQVIAEQSAKIAYAHAGFFASEAAEGLADFILENEPGGLTHAFFVSSGSEAVEAAIKLARQYFLEIGEPSRFRIIARRQSYHGVTLGGLSAGGHLSRRAPFEPILSPAFSHVSPCFAYHHLAPSETDEQYVKRLADELDAEFQRLGPETVTAFCAETVVGAASGCVTAVPGYFKAMKDICDKYGSLLILDEVMCGMGRTGTLHAWEQEGVFPDIQVIAKGLGGGYQPIGGILVGGKIVDALRVGSGSFVHLQTYQGHPVACAAALEVQRIIRENNLLANVVDAGKKLASLLIERFGNHHHVGDVRGRGLFHAIEFVSDRSTKTPFDRALRLNELVKEQSLSRGLSIYPSAGTADGIQGDHVIIAPPYTVSHAELEMIVDRLGDAVDAAILDI